MDFLVLPDAILPRRSHSRRLSIETDWPRIVEHCEILMLASHVHLKCNLSSSSFYRVIARPICQDFAVFLPEVDFSWAPRFLIGHLEFQSRRTSNILIEQSSLRSRRPAEVVPLRHLPFLRYRRSLRRKRISTTSWNVEFFPDARRSSLAYLTPVTDADESSNQSGAYNFSTNTNRHTSPQRNHGDQR